eukprot:scaffold43052_cov66-Attheya_sp.AAC.2
MIQPDIMKITSQQLTSLLPTKYPVEFVTSISPCVTCTITMTEEYLLQSSVAELYTQDEYTCYAIKTAGV